jgi:hypothetical protein
MEIENWFEIGLANMQRYMVNYVSGPPAQYIPYLDSNQSKTDPGLKWLCGSQMIQRNDYTNFSTLAISSIFGLGLLTIGTSFGVENLVGYYRLKWRNGYWRQTAWWSEGTLQLQRQAFQGMGIGDWNLKEWDMVPLTSKGNVWSSLRDSEERGPGVERQKTVSGGDMAGSAPGSSDDGSSGRKSSEQRVGSVHQHNLVHERFPEDQENCQQGTDIEEHQIVAPQRGGNPQEKENSQKQRDTVQENPTAGPQNIYQQRESFERQDFSCHTTPEQRGSPSSCGQPQ